MIGDWVYRTDFNTPVPSKIIGIEVVNYDKMEYVVDVFNKNGYNVQLYLNEIEPILLTPEILEKNGFRKSVSPPGIHAKCYEIEDKDKKYCLTIANYNRYKRLLLNVDSEDSECFNIKCDYVHELQHALRLCKIDKTITL